MLENPLIFTGKDLTQMALNFCNNYSIVKDAAYVDYNMFC